MRQGKRAEVVEQFDSLNKERAHQDRARRFHRCRGASARRAVDRLATTRASTTRASGAGTRRPNRFEEALRYKDDASHSPLARYNLADAYRHLARQRDAIPMLIQLSEASPDKEVMDDATYLLAECLIDIQAWNDAKNTLRSFMRRFSDSPYFNEVRMHLAEISLPVPCQRRGAARSSRAPHRTGARAYWVTCPHARRAKRK